ncbi:MAG: uncharacterized protein KVP18_000991 [Porospora cf. gigantea A]|uniref:uncharacterized protein n=1 Tax=Porospora cf. gigantea A TaxID=2853593 RepID=UPI00355AAA2C|nr:MAG: hypothetical protein KVP18_000991 [Porospora cf. gigantea A]
MGNQQTSLVAHHDLKFDTSEYSYVPPTEADLGELLTHRAIVERKVESREDRLERYVRALSPSIDELRLMKLSFVDELVRGIEQYPRHWDPAEMSFKMLDSCLKGYPLGSEAGVRYAVDFGGTNFRAVRCSFKDGKVDVRSSCVSLLDAPGAEALEKGLLDRKATALLMFDYFARHVKDFMSREGDLQERLDADGEVLDSKRVDVGFTFSFPCQQAYIDRASLIVWTKGFETGRGTIDPVEGADVAELLNIAFIRNQVPAVVNAVVNDTVGTQVSCDFDQRARSPCLVGMILGTGFNTSYSDIDAQEHGYQGHIINIESGNFNRDLPRCNIDYEVDFADSAGRGQQHLEKMVAGKYLGEVVRRAFIKVLQSTCPASSWTRDSLSSFHVAAICGDKSSNLIVAQKVVKEIWDVELDAFHLQVLRRLCHCVFERSAAMAAVVVCATSERTGYLQPAMGGLTIGIDGSLYKENQFYRDAMRRYVRELIGPESADLIRICMAEDGSGRGAGIVSMITESKA